MELKMKTEINNNKEKIKSQKMFKFPSELEESNGILECLIASAIFFSPNLLLFFEVVENNFFYLIIYNYLLVLLLLWNIIHLKFKV